MRFSDMMGSGADRSGKKDAAAEADPVIANALAPYLDAPKPPEADEPFAALAERAEPLAGAARAENNTIAPAVAFQPTPPQPDVVAAFTPLSDDLLPRKR
jgi:hypothetical protein